MDSSLVKEETKSEMLSEQPESSYYEVNKLLNIPLEVEVSPQSLSEVIAEFERIHEPVSQKIVNREDFTIIDTKELLNDLVAQILSGSETSEGENCIGIDTENESVYSYKGYL